MKLIKTSFIAFAILLAAGCAKEYDDTSLLERIEDIQAESEANANTLKRLEKKLDEAIAQGLEVSVQETNDGYVLTFTDGTSITINHGEDGDRGPQGPEGTAGEAGTCSIVSINETSDGNAYVIKIGDNEYTVNKADKSFALKLDKVELSLSPNQTAEIPYTLINADETTVVTVRSCSGYTAEVDQINKKVRITAPAELPADGYVVFTAVKNSTGEKSSQYVSFVSGTLTVTADAETVAAAGGTVTLTVNANCEYTVSLPDGCTWIRQIDRRSMTTSYVYLAVDENTTTDERTATVSLVSTAGVKSIVIVQKGKKVIDANAFNIYPEDAAEKLADIAAMTPAELDGQTINFTAGDYTEMQTLTIAADQAINLTVTGSGAKFSTGGTVFNFTKVNATFDGLTFNGCKRAISLNSGNSTIEECTFSNNNSSDIGGAVYMNGEAVVAVKNCTFSGNKAQFGADLYMVDGNLTVENCSFTGSEVTFAGACLAMNSKNPAGETDAEAYSKIKAVVKNSTFTSIKSGTSLTDGADDAPCGVISCPHGDLTVEGCTFDGCEGKSGTIVSLASRPSRWAYKYGNALLKMNNCVVKNSSLVRLGLIYINAGGFGDNPGRRHVAFINNSSFINTTSSTGNYGTIAHSGGDGGLIMMNNCTVYGVNLESDGNGFAINTDGYILVSNSTFVADTRDGFFRNGNANGNIKVINTIGINTKEGSTGSIVGETGKPFTTDGHCIYGPANDKTADLTDAIKNATTATLAGYLWDESASLVKWNGPAADFSKLASSQFQGLLNGWGPKTPILYDEASAGEAFYNWLVEIEAVGKDARGISRGTSWWPGAYQN